MKALRTKICAYAVVLFASLSLAMTTSVKADSSDFAGLFVAVHASVNGAALDGTHTGGTVAGYTARGEEVSNGQLGAFVPVAGFEAGFNLPLGSVFFLGVGGTMVNGSADLVTSDNYGNDADITIEVKDIYTWWVQPSVAIGNAAMYFKFGTSKADLQAIGDVTGGPGNLNGDMYAIGVQSMSPVGLYLKAESGVTQYDKITVTGISGSTYSTVEADPIVAFGAISIGYKF